MDLKMIVELFVNNGLAIVIVAFYLYKDYKFNEQLVKSLQEITDTLKDFKN